jgi:very-short-patch-repair endonuclease
MSIKAYISKERYKDYLKSKTPVKTVAPDKTPDIELWARQLRNRQLRKPSRLELKFKRLLDLHNIDYVWQKIFIFNGRYVCVDFYFQNSRTVIEVDGPYHEKKKQKRSDVLRTNWIKSNTEALEVLRIHYTDLSKLGQDQIVDLVFDKL